MTLFTTFLWLVEDIVHLKWWYVLSNVSAVVICVRCYIALLLETSNVFGGSFFIWRTSVQVSVNSSLPLFCDRVFLFSKYGCLSCSCKLVPFTASGPFMSTWSHFLSEGRLIGTEVYFVKFSFVIPNVIRVGKPLHWFRCRLTFCVIASYVFTQETFAGHWLYVG